MRLSSLCNSLLLAAARLAIGKRGLFLFLIVLVLALVGAGGDPETALARTLHWSILTGEVDSFALVAVVAALGKSASASRELRLDSGVLLNPVGEGVLAILDNTGHVSIRLSLSMSKHKHHLRLAGLVSVVSVPGLTRGHWGIVDQLEEMLSESGDDGKLLRVLTKSIELVGISRL